MSEVFDTGSKAELIKQIDAQPGASRDTLDTLTANNEHENDDAEQERREKAAAKKAKMEENKKLREEKWKAEDDKASRRSARSSMLSKANDLVSGITSSVLGKRKDRVAELRGSGRSRPQSAIEPLLSTRLPLRPGRQKTASKRHCHPNLHQRDQRCYDPPHTPSTQR